MELICHRRRDLVEWQPIHEAAHVGHVVDGNAHFAHLTECQPGIGIEPHLGREIEGYRQTSLACLQQGLEASVGFLRRPVPGVLAHRPRPTAVHRGVRPTGVWELTWLPQLAVGSRSVDGVDVDTARRRPICGLLGVVSSALRIRRGSHWPRYPGLWTSQNPNPATFP